MPHITYLKQEFTHAIYDAFTSLKVKISSDILNYELSILYKNKIYDQDARVVQADVFTLSEDIDYILNEHCDNCLKSIEGILDKIKSGAEQEEKRRKANLVLL